MVFNLDNDFFMNYEKLKLQKLLPNYSDKSSQRLNENFDLEMYSIWKDFNDFKIIIELNQKKNLKNYGNWILYLNFNSFKFYRDANFSLSLICGNIELAVISFFPVKNKTLRIVQLQGQKGFEPNNGLLKDWKLILVDELKIFAYNLGFKKLEILRGEKNYLFKFPRNVDENFNLKEHQERMLYIYNILPVKQWGFKYKNNDDYSKFSF